MPGDGGGVTVPLSLFSGLVTELSVPDIPEGLSPDNQDVVFLPGSVASRPGMHKVYASAIAGNVTVVYQKTYVQPNGQPINLILDSAGNLWKEDITNAPGTLASLGTVPAGSYAQSCSAFGREYIAISDGVHGSGVPLQFDGTHLDRVTQDGPGAPPTLSNFAPTSAAIAGTGSPISATIAAPSTGIVWGGLQVINDFKPFIRAYTFFTVTTTAPHGFTAGQRVTIAGSTSTPSVNATWTIATVPSSTTFTVSQYAGQSTAVNGGNGTVTITSSSTSMSRQANVVNAVTSAPHGFQVGWQVQVSGIANTNIGTGIASISRDGNGVVTVVTSGVINSLPVGATIVITGVTNPDTSYNGTFVVASVLSPSSFTYSQVGTVTASGAGTGNVQDVWNTTAFIQSVPTTTTFTYSQLGPNDSTTATGTATILGQVSAGIHQCVLMFLTRQGYLTAPSIPVQIDANGSQQISVSNLALGPANVIARVLAFTGTGGDNYFTLLTTPLAAGLAVGSALIINDNVSTAAIVDFADNTLFGGKGIDIPGSNQFAQIVLGPAAGFFSYASRLFSWGEYNKLQNLVNMGFDGGYLFGTSFPLGWQTGATFTFTANAGSGANDGGAGIAWTNPNNVTSLVSYASVALTALASSEGLMCETFGLSIPVGLNSDTVAQVSVVAEAYAAIAGAGSVLLTAQLLKAGVAVGTSQTFPLTNSSGSSGAPATATFIFTLPPLSPSDLNSATFGVRIVAQQIEVPSNASAFIRNVHMNPILLTQTTPSGTIALVATAPAGFAVQMTSAATTQDCLLFQSAYQDNLGIAILEPNQGYEARLKVFAGAGLTGSLIAEIYSPSVGSLATATFNVATLPIAAKFVTQAFSAPMPAVIPVDTVFRWYLNNVTNNGVVTIDEGEIIPTQNPYLDNVMRGSYANAPEQFDGVTGNIGPASDSSPLRCLFEMRDVLYLDTAAGRHQTIDNATGEPSTWSVRELSQSFGALSLKASDTGKLGTGDSGEQFEFTASRSGLYIFWGGEMVKVSQEIQTLWDSINFNVKQTVWVKNDPVTRRCYVGLPLNTATAPNVILVLDYRELNTPEAIASTAPFRQSFSGRMLASEICRKWTKWSVQSNSGEILTLSGGQQLFTVGAGNGQTPGTANGFGNIYYFDASKLTDDDYGQIVPFWTTYFFVSNDQEQALQLDSHRKLATYFSAFISGVGLAAITPLSDTLANAFPPLAAYPFSASQSHDLEWPINVDGERIALKIGSAPAAGQTDNSFNLQKLALTMKKHPWSAVRGAF